MRTANRLEKFSKNHHLLRGKALEVKDYFTGLNKFKTYLTKIDGKTISLQVR
jgi:hypothetical protein